MQRRSSPRSLWSLQCLGAKPRASWLRADTLTQREAGMWIGSILPGPWVLWLVKVQFVNTTHLLFCDCRKLPEHQGLAARSQVRGEPGPRGRHSLNCTRARRARVWWEGQPVGRAEEGALLQEDASAQSCFWVFQEVSAAGWGGWGWAAPKNTPPWLELLTQATADVHKCIFVFPKEQA